MADKRKGKRIDVFVHETDYAMLQHYLIRSGRTISGVMREALNDFLKVHIEDMYISNLDNSGDPGYYKKL